MLKNLRTWLLKKLGYEDQLVHAKHAGYQEAAREFEKTVIQEINKRYTGENWIVNPENVLNVVKERMSLGGNPLTEADKKNLQAEAKFLEASRIWRVFQDTLRQQAIEMSVLNSTNFDHVLGGKMMVHNLGIQKEVVRLLVNLK